MIIGIDPSLSSTGLSILKNGKIILYNYNNKKSNYKWFKNTSDIINYIHHIYIFGKNFSESEINKLKIFDEVTDKIIDTIIKYVNENEDIKVFIEGFSYSSKGNIIDLVVFSTLIRYKLLKIPNLELNIIPPSSLKSFIGSEVYNKDKKGIYRNENGKAAGSFDKKDMMEALLKLDLNFEYMNYLRYNKNILLSTKTIPSPFTDLNDSILLMYYGIKQNNKT